MNKKFKITSKGKPFDTLITDMETGKPLGYVQKLTWSVSAEDQLPRCVIEVIGVEMDVETFAEVKNISVNKTSYAVDDSGLTVKKTHSVESKTHSDEWLNFLTAAEQDTSLATVSDLIKPLVTKNSDKVVVKKKVTAKKTTKKPKAK